MAHARVLMSRPPPRFGIWAPYRAALDELAARRGGHFAAARETVLSAERAGFDSVLLVQYTLNPLDPEGAILEAWTAAAALAALTRRIEIIAAAKPYLYHPAVLAKQALGIEDISGGRFAVNYVNAWFIEEMERAGLPFPEHDERYRYGAEWLRVFKALIAGERVTFSGEYFQLDDYRLRPVSSTRPRPIVYAGGSSEPARALIATQADVWLINAVPFEAFPGLIAEMARRPRPGAPLAFGATGFVLARPGEKEAREAVEALYERKERHRQLQRESGAPAARIDPRAAMTRFQYPEGQRCVIAFGDTLSDFIGSYDRVARRIVDFHRLGVDFFLNSFHPEIEEQERFAAEVIPRVHALLRRS